MKKEICEKKINIKLFLTAFIISSLFSYWTSWNEEANYALVKSIIENDDLNLKDFLNVTRDIVYLENKYYVKVHRIITLLSTANLYTVISPIAHNEDTKKAFLTIFTGPVFFSLSTVVMYKFMLAFTKDYKKSLILTFVYFLSTPVFQHSRFLTTHPIEILLTSISIYIYTKISIESTKNKEKYLFLLGILLAILFVSNRLAITLVFFIFMDVLRKKSIESLKSFLILLFGFIITPLEMSYIAAVNPEDPIYKGSHLYTIYIRIAQVLKDLSMGLPTYSKLFVNTHIGLSKVKGEPVYPKDFENQTFPISSMLQILFYPSKGFFFYYPILILSVIGLFYGLRDKNLSSISKVSLLTFFTSLMIISFLYPPWWFGWVSYGTVRTLTFTVPLLIIGLVEFTKRFGFKILIPFIIISTLNNFLLFQYGEDKISTLSWDEYKYKMGHLKILSNPLFEHYIPLTLINGPRSVLLENLVINKKIYIGMKHPCNEYTPDFTQDSPIIEHPEISLFSLSNIGTVVMRLQSLSIYILIGILYIIWRDDLLKIKRFNEKKILLIYLILFFLLFIRIKTFVIDKGWYPPDCDWYYGECERGRWFSDNASIILFSNKNSSETIIFDVDAIKYPKQLEIHLNDRLISSYNISKETRITENIQLNKGLNRITFKSVSKCQKPSELNLSCDTRCLSFKITFVNLS